MTARPAPVLVVGLGSVGGDDAVGPLVVGAAAQRVSDPRVEVVPHADPTTLADLMSDRSLVVVVDAVRSGAPPGRLILREVGAGTAGLVVAAEHTSSHGWGLAEAVEMARVLGTLPPRVLVVGIEAAAIGVGTGLDRSSASNPGVDLTLIAALGPEPALSPPVAAAVPAAVEAVLAEVATASPRPAPVMECDHDTSRIPDTGVPPRAPPRTRHGM